MALQTSTGTSSASPTSTSTSSTTGSGNGTNSGAGLLGSDGATPLVPAFLLAALLLVGILALMYFRRRRSGPFRPQRGAALGPLDARFHIGNRLGAGYGMGAAREGREEKRERPTMWDVFLDPRSGRQSAKEMEAGGEFMGWCSMKPLSAALVSGDIQRPKEPQPHPMRGRWVFNWGLPAGHPSSRPANSTSTDIASSANNSPEAKSDEKHLRVGVMVAMPQQRRADDKGEVDDLGVVLGVAEVPYIEGEGEETQGNTSDERSPRQGSSPAG